MNGKNILNFLRQLTAHNNREWYNEVKAEFEHMGEELIVRISEFDPDVRFMKAKDCIFRIYRDTRFSIDKTPYKDHMGIFIAAKGFHFKSQSLKCINMCFQHGFLTSGESQNHGRH